MASTVRVEINGGGAPPRAAQPIDEARLAPAYELLEREAVPAQSPSAVLAVARREGPATIRAFGLARWDPEEVPADADTIYALASITKPFVALAAVQLAERGELTLDDRLVRYLPEFAAAGAPHERADRERITLRHLLTHTSGPNADWQDPRATAA